MGFQDKETDVTLRATRKATQSTVAHVKLLLEIFTYAYICCTAFLNRYLGGTELQQSYSKLWYLLFNKSILYLGKFSISICMPSNLKSHVRKHNVLLSQESFSLKK